MTSYAKMTQSVAANLSRPSTSSGASTSANAGSSTETDDTNTVTRILYDLFENLNRPSTSSQAASASTSSAIPYDIWALSSQSTLDRPGPSTSRDSFYNNNDQGRSREDRSSDSPGTCSSVSLACSRCEDRPPTNRCLECNDLYCHDCCHDASSECQVRDHTLLTLNQVSPIGVRPNSVEAICCEDHKEQVKFYCEHCTSFICQQCTLREHRDHYYSPIKGALDNCRLGVARVIEDMKTGTKAVKAAIDRAVSLSKAYDKEALEASVKIRRSMRIYMQAIEDREKYLLDKIERMRVAKSSHYAETMQTLRCILSGLANNHENLSSLNKTDNVGIKLFAAKEKARSSVGYYSSIFKQMRMTEEKIMFIPPNYDLVDVLKRQGDVQTISVSALQTFNAASTLQTRQSLVPYYQTPHTYPPLTYNVSMNSLRSYPDYPTHSRSINFYDQSVSPTIAIESNPARGIGQAISGHFVTVSMKPCRSAIPGVPMFSFGREGSEEGQVSRPWGLCIDKEGNIIVADRRNNRVQIYSNRGEFMTMFGTKGTGPGEFDLPAGITTDIHGRIIVIDKDNHRVQIFTSTGGFILKFGSFGKDNGQFQYPWDVAVNTLGNIVVTDTRNHRIQLFTSDGAYITKFVFESSYPGRMLKGPTTPRGVCFTITGNIIVSDFENHRLMLVDSTLTKVLHCVGREGSAIGELNRPSGIVTDDEGRVIVADSKNHRVLVFTSELNILWAVDLKSPGLDDKDRPSDVALTLEGCLVVLFETLPDTGRDLGIHAKQYIKIY